MSYRYKTPTLAEITHEMEPFGLRVGTSLSSSIRAYLEILDQWNQKISLTSVRDPLVILSRHFGESFYVESLLGGVLEGRLADVGSGAGFPGLALKLLLPDLDVELIESNLKKAAFLSEVVRRLDLKGVKVVRKRFQQVRTEADFVSARALGQSTELLEWARKALIPGGRFLLWAGQDAVARLSSLRDWEWMAPQAIPKSKKRFILVGTPVGKAS